ncbi:hypothetical protein DSM100688_1596 [Bifidobacterium ramosum]|uniref:DUF4352 domain-containing protein n=1 Tax=Bifidobacterium ramosum TaxID=1798158 RepID=A0A6L4X1L8_9BIFI|nr:hypothetical protein [Bifidobacterium ramosum]KAB8287509.1 hypothetical protein DSM100688_1596 [Bifidobacterium ramosum]NEG72229.1 hypothetical protein [Bifidobacterium ramosum]
MRNAIRKTVGLTLGAIAVVSMLAACGSTPSSTSVADSIGSMPGYLAKYSGNSSIANGSVGNPALSFPGSPVNVSMGKDKGEVRIDIDGPSYPSTGKVSDDAVPATFTATITNTAKQGGATVSLSKSVFDVLDNGGATHVLIPSPALPKELAPGQQVKVELRTTAPSGEGLLRFRPDGGNSAAGWDYVMEID